MASIHSVTATAVAAATFLLYDCGEPFLAFGSLLFLARQPYLISSSIRL